MSVTPVQQPGPTEAGTQILLVAETGRWSHASAVLAHEPESHTLEVVISGFDDAEHELDTRVFEAAVVDLSRDGERRLSALERWRREHPRTAWVVVTGSDPDDRDDRDDGAGGISEERLLRAGVDEQIPHDAASGRVLERAVRRAIARHAAPPSGEPPPWESPGIQATRLASLGVLAAGVAHEINNPIAYVRSNLEFVSEEFEAIEDRMNALVRRFPNVAGGSTGFPDLEQRLKELREAVGEAREGTARVAEVVGGLKQFSSRPRNEVRELDLREVTESTLRIARNALRQRARLEKRLGPVPPVRGGEAYLGQVVLNLLVNAVQAMTSNRPEDNQVVLTTRTDAAGNAVLEVADNGGGMDADVAERVFEPFFTTKPPGEGTGLGLAVCRSVVESYGGTLSVSSRPGEGSTFRVTLPPA